MKSSIWEAFKMRQKHKLGRTKPCSFLGYYPKEATEQKCADQ